MFRVFGKVSIACIGQGASGTPPLRPGPKRGGHLTCQEALWHPAAMTVPDPMR